MGKTRRSGSKTSRRSRRSRRNVRRRQMGGGVKEEALAALAAAGKTTDSMTSELYTSKTTETINGYTFKFTPGFYNSTLYAKMEGANDSTYLEIDTNHIGSQ